MDLDGVTAVVTGGAAGIGAGIAQRLAADGMRVVIADLDQNAGQATAARVGGSFVRTDVATRAGVRAAIGTACQLPGRVGVLVNNAGGIEGPSFPAAGPATWEHTLDLNLRAVMLATQLVLAPMAEGGGGAIINIASVAGLGTTSHQSPEYAAAKAAVIRFTACLAPLHDTIGVRANCICPGLVDTPASRRSRARLTPAELAALPPVLTPADIADAAMQFIADDALAGRIMVCRGGEPSHLLPLTDWQTVLPVLGRRPGYRQPHGGRECLRWPVREPSHGALPGGVRLLRLPGAHFFAGVAVLVLGIGWAVRADAGRSAPAWGSPEGIVPLSEHERRQLEQIEAALRAGDRRFAGAVRAADPRVHYRRRVLAAVLGFLAGVGLLLAGVVVNLILIAVAGFVVMLACTLWAVTSYRRMTGRAPAKDRGPGNRRRAARGRRASTRAGPGLMGRLEERWRRRQQGDR
jgi:NAD(P)-dependent dehydrogenase (short-subunit alcohol dehydrogenase family)